MALWKSVHVSRVKKGGPRSKSIRMLSCIDVCGVSWSGSISIEGKDQG